MTSDGCAGCASLQGQLLALSGRLRREALRHPAPDALRAALRSRIADAAPRPEPGAALTSMGGHAIVR